MRKLLSRTWLSVRLRAAEIRFQFCYSRTIDQVRGALDMCDEVVDSLEAAQEPALRWCGLTEQDCLALALREAKAARDTLADVLRYQP